jgi:hypothetical protein
LQPANFSKETMLISPGRTVIFLTLMAIGASHAADGGSLAACAGIGDDGERLA